MSKLLPLILLIAVVTLTLSCSKPKQEQTDPPKSAGEIIDKYVDTLSTATDKARSAADMADTHNEEEIKALEAIDAQ